MISDQVSFLPLCPSVCYSPIRKRFVLFKAPPLLLVLRERKGTE
jgi:hypothetical protein